MHSEGYVSLREAPSLESLCGVGSGLVAMAVRSVLVAVLVGLCCSGSLVEAVEREVEQERLGRFEFSEEDKRNNYEGFRFTEGRHEESSGATFEVGEPEYRGADSSSRYPSSYELIHARQAAGARLTNARHVKAGGAARSQGSSRFYTPASDPDFAFRFARPASHQESAFSQFHFDNSEAINDPTATYGTTTPVQRDRSSASGHGCANMYWAEHTKQWPAFFTVSTQVAQAFGMKAGAVYGTTTLLQALYDTREDGYSQLLSHGTAALMNAYAMPGYGLRHDAVIDQFLGALSSRSAAGVQAQKFLLANHANGPDECMN